MTLTDTLNPDLFLDAAALEDEWAQDNTYSDGQVMNEEVYRGHCCLRAIGNVNHGRGYLTHLHRAFFSYLFCPPRIPKHKPYWNCNYEARILALCLAAAITDGD